MKTSRSVQKCEMGVLQSLETMACLRWSALADDFRTFRSGPNFFGLREMLQVYLCINDAFRGPFDGISEPLATRPIATWKRAAS